uniref:Uncharacterized protein n=1 Tax=Oryza punctata TaxID=4537 RepID=A0A0E0LVT6_ORYPU
MTPPPQRPSGSKVEAERRGCCDSEEVGSSTPLPILDIFLHIAATVRYSVLVRHRRRRRRGVVRQLMLRGREGGLRWGISTWLVGFVGRWMRRGGGR